MFENLYTTKMSANKKILQNRFSKIRAGSGRLSKLLALVMSVFVAVTMLVSTVAMAALDTKEEELITLYAGESEITLQNKPFIKDNMTYFPLREMFEKLGVLDVPGNSLEWDNGVIHMTVKEQEDSRPTYYKVSIGSDSIGVAHEESAIKLSMVPAERVPALLVGGKTYVPYTFIDYMLNRGLGIHNMETFDFLFTVNAESKTAFISQGFRWPTEGHVSNGFGTRTHPITGETKSHNGVDIAAAEGATVQSAIFGTVTETGFDAERGNYIIIEYGHIVTTAYHHLSEISVSQGDKVFSGAIIGKVGKTGQATGAHLHFEVTVQDEYIDPERIG